ncbi:MAG: hypothetical protein AAF871_15570 [Pseudomonadota bacterium]
MEMLGRDPATATYRIAVGDGADRRIVRLPEAVMAGGSALTGGHGHQTAYEWVAQHGRAIETAAQALVAGRPAKPPFETMELEQGAPAPARPET